MATTTTQLLINSKKTYAEIVAEIQKRSLNSNPCFTNQTDFDELGDVKIVFEQVIEKIRTSIEREKKRRAVQWKYTPYTNWEDVINPADKTIRGETYVELLNRIEALGTVDTQPSIDKFNDGKIISKDALKQVVKALNDTEYACLCDCNYCTCDCNYCTCDCNYCTCDCNYHVTLSHKGPDGTYYTGFKGSKTSLPSIKDKTKWDESTVTTNATIWAYNYCNCDCNYCTCDCNYCTCDCNYCTCDCNYCTCDCNYCTCDCNYCTCDCNYCTCDCNYCTCDCNYCTCNCNYCTCDCNYCTCDCNYCTCDCNYCTCNCNFCTGVYYSRRCDYNATGKSTGTQKGVTGLSTGTTSTPYNGNTGTLIKPTGKTTGYYVGPVHPK